MNDRIKGAKELVRAQELVARFHRNANVTLWTIQRPEVWETAKQTGVLRADGRRAFSGFRRQYRWMISQAKQRIPGYSGRYPVWAWFHPKPDLRSSALLPSGTRGVRIEFQVPVDRVLLSDFDLWHVPLNDGYLAMTEKDDEDFDRVLPEKLTPFDQLPPHLQQRIESSWERIFDIDALEESEYTRTSGTPNIQAVIEEVQMEEIRQVTPFTAR